MKREIQYDNDEQGRFYVAYTIKGREMVEIFHDAYQFGKFVVGENNFRERIEGLLKPSPGLAKRVIEKKRLEQCRINKNDK